MADPDFPDGSANPEMTAKTYYLPRFLPKPAWKLKKLDREGSAGGECPPPSDPPITVQDNVVTGFKHTLFYI